MKRINFVLLTIALTSVLFDNAYAQRTEPCRPQGATRGLLRERQARTSNVRWWRVDGMRRQS